MFGGPRAADSCGRHYSQKLAQTHVCPSSVSGPTWEPSSAFGSRLRSEPMSTSTFCVPCAHSSGLADHTRPWRTANMEEGQDIGHGVEVAFGPTVAHAAVAIQLCSHALSEGTKAKDHVPTSSQGRPSIETPMQRVGFGATLGCVPYSARKLSSQSFRLFLCQSSSKHEDRGHCGRNVHSECGLHKLCIRRETGIRCRDLVLFAGGHDLLGKIRELTTRLAVVPTLECETTKNCQRSSNSSATLFSSSSATCH